MSALRPLPFLAALGLLVLPSCGGGGSSPTSTPTSTYATAIAYTNPTTSGWALVKDASSTSTHLVLDLVGPSGTSTLGVALFLTADASKVAWSAPASGGGLVQAGSVIPLGASPQMLTAKAQAGNLQVGLFQKGGSATSLGSAPILSVALDLAGASVAKGGAGLAAESGKTSISLNADGTTTTLSVAVGTLTLQ